MVSVLIFLDDLCIFTNCFFCSWLVCDIKLLLKPGNYIVTWDYIYIYIYSIHTSLSHMKATLQEVRDFGGSETRTY